jgi:hypothetical protein
VPYDPTDPFLKSAFLHALNYSIIATIMFCWFTTLLTSNSTHPTLLHSMQSFYQHLQFILLALSDGATEGVRQSRENRTDLKQVNK